MTPMSNRYPATCQCGTFVPARAGACIRRASRYAVLCANCTPYPTERMERARNNAQAGEAAERAYAAWMALGAAEALRKSHEIVRAEKMRDARKRATAWAKENIACTCASIHYAGDHDATHTPDCDTRLWAVQRDMGSTVTVVITRPHLNRSERVRTYTVDTNDTEAHDAFLAHARNLWERVRTNA